MAYLAKLFTLFGKLALMLGALLLTLLLLELVVFRYVLVPSDVVRNATLNGIVRYQPNTVSIIRDPDGTSHRVTINAQGWNSTKPTYRIQKKPGVLRVAVIGDSYVHAMPVDVADGFPEVMERELKARGVKAEVYRFGVDGAPLSQYLDMLRKEVVQYRPDVVVVQLIHNDLDESYRMVDSRLGSNFLKFRRTEEGSFEEIPPTPFTPGVADVLRESAMFRYLYYTTGLSQRLRLFANLWWGKAADDDPTEFTSSAVDTRSLDDPDQMRDVTRFIVGEMASVAEREGFRLVFSMDAVREAIYADKPRSNYAVSVVNDIAAEVIRKRGLPFIDLQTAMTQCYRASGQRLEHAWDWHWNVAGNKCAADAIVALLLSDPGLVAGDAKAASAPERKRA